MSSWNCIASIATVFTLLAYLAFPNQSAADEGHKHTIADRKPVCLKEYPHEADELNGIVGPHAKQIIEKHGMQEWIAVLLTNELHRHLGMWNIVGAKMGVRAMEVLAAPFDELRVVSMAGFDPPFSCINDGVQVSTGATLGRGTITVAQFKKPEVIFYYKDKKLLMKVKPEISKEIGKLIQEYSEKYVFQSARYFQELDKLAMEYWLKWDRKALFQEILI